MEEYTLSVVANGVNDIHRLRLPFHPSTQPAHMLSNVCNAHRYIIASEISLLPTGMHIQQDALSAESLNLRAKQ